MLFNSVLHLPSQLQRSLSFRFVVSAMNQCPAELLCYIFAEACTDDGHTGRALALVSHRIRSISRPYALQSVALYGSHQIAAFAAHLDQVSAHERRVRNVYLTDRRRVWMEYRAGQARTEWLRERITEDFHVIDPSREYSADPILRIFEYVAPTLRICTLLLFDRYSEQALRMPFVALEELSIYGSLLNHNGYPQVPLCPRLRRLHFVQDFSAVKSIARAIAHIGPNLTHLRVSRLVPSAAGAGDVVRGLEQMIQQQQKDGTPSQCGFPPTLQRVIIQIASQQEMRDVSGTVSVRCHRSSPSPFPHTSLWDLLTLCTSAAHITCDPPAEGYNGARYTEEDHRYEAASGERRGLLRHAGHGRRVLHGHQGALGAAYRWPGRRLGSSCVRSPLIMRAQ